MKRALLAAALLLAWVLAPALSVDKVSFSANFPFDETALLKASGLTAGSEYTPADVNAAIALMQAWLQANGHPFVKIANPELVPLSESSQELAFKLTEVLLKHRIANSASAACAISLKQSCVNCSCLLIKARSGFPNCRAPWTGFWMSITAAATSLPVWGWIP